MRCKEFLRAYSDYRDGRITDAGAVRRVHEHLAACERCRYYDRTIARGVNALRGAHVDPDPGGAARLQALATPAAHVPPVPAHASLIATVLVVAAFGLMAWDAVRDSPVRPEAQTEARAARSKTLVTPPVVVANPGVPFVRFADFAAPAEPAPGSDELPSVASSLTLYQGSPDR